MTLKQHHRHRAHVGLFAAWLLPALFGAACTADLVQLQEANCGHVGEHLGSCVKPEDLGFDLTPSLENNYALPEDAIRNFVSSACYAAFSGNQECRNCLAAYPCDEVASSCEETCKSKAIDPKTLAMTGAQACMAGSCSGSGGSSSMSFDTGGSSSFGTGGRSSSFGSGGSTGSNLCKSHDDCPSRCCVPTASSPTGGICGQSSGACQSCSVSSQCGTRCCSLNRCAPAAACGI